jgi:hypothetical protein
MERNLQQLSESTKRRSTMNSRAAYDEDEVLRKVLEESKVEDATNPSETGTRRGKRGRDESEEYGIELRRLRNVTNPMLQY